MKFQTVPSFENVDIYIQLYTIIDPCEEDLLTIAKLEEELKEAKEQACPGEGIYTVPGKNLLPARFTLIILFCISPSVDAIY